MHTHTSILFMDTSTWKQYYIENSNLILLKLLNLMITNEIFMQYMRRSVEYQSVNHLLCHCLHENIAHKPNNTLMNYDL